MCTISDCQVCACLNVGYKIKNMSKKTKQLGSFPFRKLMALSHVPDKWVIPFTKAEFAEAQKIVLSQVRFWIEHGQPDDTQLLDEKLIHFLINLRIC